MPSRPLFGLTSCTATASACAPRWGASRYRSAPPPRQPRTWVFMCVCVYIYIYIYTHIHTHIHIYIYIWLLLLFVPPQTWVVAKNGPIPFLLTVSVKKTLLSWQPFPCSPAAETALQPPIWFFESRFPHMSSSTEEYFFTDTGICFVCDSSLPFVDASVS